MKLKNDTTQNDTTIHFTSLFIFVFNMDQTTQTMIDLCIEYPEVRQVLNDIKQFQQQTITRLYIDHINTLNDCGFPFTQNSLTARKTEIKNYIASHPEVMNNDLEILLTNIIYQVNQEQKLKQKSQEMEARRMRERLMQARRDANAKADTQPYDFVVKKVPKKPKKEDDEMIKMMRAYLKKHDGEQEETHEEEDQKDDDEQTV